MARDLYRLVICLWKVEHLYGLQIQAPWETITPVQFGSEITPSKSVREIWQSFLTAQYVVRCNHFHYGYVRRDLLCIPKREANADALIDHDYNPYEKAICLCDRGPTPLKRNWADSSSRELTSCNIPLVDWPWLALLFEHEVGSLWTQ